MIAFCHLHLGSTYQEEKKGSVTHIKYHGFMDFRSFQRINI